MADLAENLRTELVQIVGNDVPVEQGKISEETEADPRVFYGRVSEQAEVFVGGQGGLGEAHFTVEIFGTDVAEVQDMAGRIRALAGDNGLNGKHGYFGLDEVLGVYVTDQDDDYEYRGMDADEGWHAAALDVQIFT